MNKITPPTANSKWPLWGLGLSLLIPSTAIFQKYLGIAGVIAYVMIGSAILILFVKYQSVCVRTVSRLNDRHVYLLVFATFIAIIIAYTIIYPIANSGIVGGGSDNDDAANVATSELLHGRYPYHVKTYLQKPISPLPGALLLAAPFVLMGNSAYQNFFWLFLFFIAMKTHLKNSRRALLLLWVILALSPIVLYQIVTGYDYISNSIYVLLFLYWMVTAISQHNPDRWKIILPAIALGIGLSSRANFLLLLPLAYFALARKVGWISAAKYTALTITAFAVTTLPFYLYDPRGFSPLHTAGKLSQFNSIIPMADIFIILTTGIIALLLGFYRHSNLEDNNIGHLFRNCMIVLAFPVLCGMALSSVEQGKLSFDFAFFGTFFLFFGAAAFWNDIIKTTPHSKYSFEAK